MVCELTARMGLGRIVYLQIARGRIDGWAFGENARIESKKNGRARFIYDGLTYSLLMPIYQAVA